MSGAAGRLQAIRERIAAAARRAGRVPEQVRLIAVSKNQPLAAIATLADLGQRDFGESQMQEALDKIGRLEKPGLEWHFIGHLQSNKTRFVPGHFAWVHSVDSERIAARLAAATQEHGSELRLLVQVNAFDDPAKFGVDCDGLLPLVDSILSRRLTGVRLCGLMTIARFGLDAGATRRGFARTRELLHQCSERFGSQFSELSMGMSGDFELAIEEGATMVRVGTALFGSR
jgi:pyridoxal phosphate enzyme (YggS family)